MHPRIKHKVPKSCLLSLYYSIIYPHFNYCVIVWGAASKTLINKIILLQKKALRIIDRAHYLSHTTPIFKKYKLLQFYDIYKYYCTSFVFKYKYNLLPDVCKSLLIPTERNLDSHNLRIIPDFITPKYRTNMREKCITIQGPSFWNTLPNEITTANSIYIFKNKMRNFILDSY